MALEEMNFNIASFNDADAGGNNYYAGAIYEVFNLDDTLADIYSDAAGTIAIVQDGINNVSDSDGECKFYILSGSYYLLASTKRRDFQAQSNINDLSLSYEPWATVAAMQADVTVLPVGKKVFWRGYYAESDGGNNWGVVKSGAHTDDGGEFFTLANGNYVQANADGLKNIKKWGAKSDGTGDSLTAIQNAIDKRGIITAPAGTYNLSDTLIMRDRARLVGEVGMWSNSTGSTCLSWGGAANGVVVQAAKSPLGTPSTSSLSGAGLDQILIKGNDVAGIGFYANYTTNESRFTNVSVTGCNLFGFLIGKVWYGLYENIVARDCDGIGIAIGENYLNTYDQIAVNGVVFNNLRGANCGVAYNAVTAPTGFDLTNNPNGGCGILIRSQSSTGYTGLFAEGNYGPGVTIATTSYTAQSIRNFYIEANMHSCVADGTSTHQFGVLLNNSNTTAGEVALTEFYGHEQDTNYRFYYLDNGGATVYNIAGSREIEVITTSTGFVPVTHKDVNATSISSGAYFTNKEQASSLIVTAPNEDTLRGCASSEVAINNRDFTSGTTITVASLPIKTESVGRGVGVSIELVLTWYSDHDNDYATTIVERYIIDIAAIQRFSTTSISSNVTQVSTLTRESGALLITNTTPSVVLDTTTGDSVIANIVATPTSLGVITNKVSVIAKASGSGLNNGKTPLLSHV